MSQEGPPWPEYVKLRTGIIASENITIGKLYARMTSRQKRTGLLSVRAIQLVQAIYHRSES